MYVKKTPNLMISSFMPSFMLFFLEEELYINSAATSRAAPSVCLRGCAYESSSILSAHFTSRAAVKRALCDNIAMMDGEGVL